MRSLHVEAEPCFGRPQAQRGGRPSVLAATSIVMCLLLCLLLSSALLLSLVLPSFRIYPAANSPQGIVSRHPSFLRKINLSASDVESELSGASLIGFSAGPTLHFATSTPSTNCITPSSSPSLCGQQGAVSKQPGPIAALIPQLPLNRSQKSNLVLGMAQDMDPKNLAVFCRSAARELTSSDVILFANNASLSRLALEIVARSQAEARAGVRFWLVVYDSPSKTRLLMRALRDREAGVAQFLLPGTLFDSGALDGLCEKSLVGQGLQGSSREEIDLLMYRAALGVVVKRERKHGAPDQSDASPEEVSEDVKTAIGSNDIKSSRREILSSKVHPSTLRWLLIRRFLECRYFREQFDRILAVDARDSAFQLDVFGVDAFGLSSLKGEIANSHRYRLHVFQGVESHPIRDDGWNKGWIEDCLGSQVLAAISSKKILCSGVTLGETEAMWRYFVQMHDLMFAPLAASAEGVSKCRQNEDGHLRHTRSQLTFEELSCSSRFPFCERNGVDQGVHNAIIHLGTLTTLKIPNDSEIETSVWSQHSSPIVNMQAGLYRLLDASRIPTEPHSKQVVNLRGDVAAIAHQYDRNAEFQNSLFIQYVYWTDISNPLHEINETKACRSFQVWQDLDFLKAMCDLSSSGGATSPAACCSRCVAAQGDGGCGAFVFSGGTCFLKARNCVLAQAGGSTRRHADAASRPDKALRPHPQSGVFSGIDMFM